MKKLSIILFLTSFMILSARGQLIKVEQVIYGMDCAPCAYGMERSFTKMDGIDEVKVSLNEGKAYLNLTKKHQLTLLDIQKQVKDGGFSPKQAEVILKGELVKANNQWRVKANDETFLITKATDSGITSGLKPGNIKLKGIIKNASGGVDNTWKLEIKEILNP